MQPNEAALLDENAFTEVDLEDFCIYRPHKFSKHYEAKSEKSLSNEFASLNEKKATGEKHWLFDGVVRYGDSRRYVQGIPFDILSIGAYEDTELHTVGSNIWIQSVNGQRLDVWYRLKSPALEYRRYYNTFLWLANLAKHVIDYLKHHQSVSLHHFKSQFYQWLRTVHAFNQDFQSWYQQYNDTDFRRAITCHCLFIYDQFRDLQLNKVYESHPIWDEIDWVDLKAVPSQMKNKRLFGMSNDDLRSLPLLEDKICRTIVTSYVFTCFEHLPWAKFLEPRPLASAVIRTRQEILDRSAHLKNLKEIQRQHDVLEKKFIEEIVSIGDVISVYPDKATDWKSNDDVWYGYVQGIQDQKKGRALKLLWLYRPSDTACQKMKYPRVQELFMSDHCNCSDRHIYHHEIVSWHKVSFSTIMDPGAEFFVRQKYVVDDSAWVSLKQSDFQCTCKDEERLPRFEIGDTLLVAINQALEPVEFVERAFDGLRIRRLLRKGRDFGDNDAEPNELVYTQTFEVINIKDVHRPCHVRFYTKNDKNQDAIPVQYRRQGTADFYYIIYQESRSVSTDLIPVSKPWPPSLNQGWDPSVASPQQTMKGLDIFCGGGSLGRGLEEGGAVKFEWAVDYFKEAIHTYSANLKNPGDTKLYCGSVNDYLSRAMEGSHSGLIAMVGAVDMISAGSPCQGFSLANLRKWTDQALLNISMVASVLSFVDFYRPKHALLENVTGMARCGTKGDDSNVFAQVLCALVGMGYQVKPFILDAWNFGSPQSRTRLFISITAPGLTPLSTPPHSHSHPATIHNRSLGKTANGLRFGERTRDLLTPFDYITIEDATKDLPINHDGRINCIPFPDHRPSRNMSTLNRVRISCIPRFPYGMNFVKASMLRWMPPPQMEGFNWNAETRSNPNAKAWKRIVPHALISTVTTGCQPEDGISGAWIHWDACRCMTVMEVRRAQGFPDREVIVGSPRIQWKIIGNSVARPVAFALGMALRKAWLIDAERPFSISRSDISLIPGATHPRPRTAGLKAQSTAMISKQLTPPKPQVSSLIEISDTSDDEPVVIATRKEQSTPLRVAPPLSAISLSRTSTKVPLSSHHMSVSSKYSRYHQFSDTNIGSSSLKTSQSSTPISSPRPPPHKIRSVTDAIERGSHKRRRNSSDDEEMKQIPKLRKRWEGTLSEI